MRFLFVIQGEGRGHQTQAIALAQLLQKEGHTIRALVGVPDGKTIPLLLQQESSFPCFPFKSPNLVYDIKTNALSIRKTVLTNLRAFPHYITSIRKIETTIQSYNPDCILNFYDVLIGIHQLICKKRQIPFFCIGHQYLLLHENFPHPKNKKWDNLILSTHTRITSLRADKLLGLSLKPFPKSTKVPHLVSIPPLIRKEVNELEPTQTKPAFLLAYLTQLVDIELLKKHTDSQIDIHLFVSKDLFTKLKALHLPDNIYFHNIHPTHFLEKMSQCKGLITTAGFESIAEAMYLQKPVLAIPITGHYEQTCNAIDAAQSGAGLFMNQPDIATFLAYIDTQVSTENTYKKWVQSSHQVMLKELTIGKTSLQEVYELQR